MSPYIFVLVMEAFSGLLSYMAMANQGRKGDLDSTGGVRKRKSRIYVLRMTYLFSAKGR